MRAVSPVSCDPGSTIQSLTSIQLNREQSDVFTELLKETRALNATQSSYEWSNLSLYRVMKGLNYMANIDSLVPGSRDENNKKMVRWGEYYSQSDGMEGEDNRELQEQLLETFSLPKGKGLIDEVGNLTQTRFKVLNTVSEADKKEGK